MSDWYKFNDIIMIINNNDNKNQHWEWKKLQTKQTKIPDALH